MPIANQTPTKISEGAQGRAIRLAGACILLWQPTTLRPATEPDAPCARCHRHSRRLPSLDHAIRHDARPVLPGRDQAWADRPRQP